jgi:hypothetical protein
MMKKLALIILCGILGVGVYGQTIKSLGYNTTNGQVVYGGTNVLTFTNDLQINAIMSSEGLFVFDVLNSTFKTGVAFEDRFEFLGVNAEAVKSQSRTNLGLGWSALTNTNAATALLGVNTNGQVVYSGTNQLTFTNGTTAFNEVNVTNELTLGGVNGVIFFADLDGAQDIFVFDNGTGGADEARARTNLGLGNGITTNRTFVSYDGTNYTTNSVTISNGIITSWTQ